MTDAPVPGSPLAAVLINDSGTTKIVLFYLLRHNNINVFATTMTATTSPAADSWDVSSRVCLSPAPTYAITGIKAGVAGTTVPLRLEVDTWYPGQTETHIMQNSLFLHAVKILQKKDPVAKLSFFQIAGIHGMPYKPWDEDTDPVTPDEGYCTHDSLLFPCWHRPYMLLYEQALFEIMTKEVIPQLPESDRKKWTDAANTWRLPYWDWAQKKTREGKDKPIYDVPLITKDPRIEVVNLKTPATTFYMDNPMYKFTMPKNKAMGLYGISDIDGVPFSKSVGTSRWAPYDPDAKTASTKWVNGLVNNSKVADALDNHPWYGNLKKPDQVPIAEMVYRLYVPDYIGNFTKFATTKYKTSDDYDKDEPAAFLSLEYIHNNIHNWTGGFDKYIGHMTEVPVAGFDPIFYMHHANVDRQFALWQAVYQKEDDINWFQKKKEQLKDDGTWSIKAGDIDTPSTPLAPFHMDTKGTYFTSDDIRDWMKWHYSYPELQPWLDKYKKDGKFDVDLYIADVRKQIKDLYSPGGDEDDTSGETTDGTTTASAKALASKPSRGLDYGWEKWTQDVIVNIIYDRFAFDGVPYTLYLFIGDPHQFALDDPNHLNEHVQNVGFVFTFSNPILPQLNTRGCQSCQRKKAEGTKSRAQVPITGALVARLQEDGQPAPSLPAGIPPLLGLGSGHVQTYLKDNLHWRVRSHTGQDLHIPHENPFVEVSVYHRNARFDVRSPDRYQRLPGATNTRPGGYGYSLQV
ncbi:Di-copper centre-containing protein [Nemania abortiva]|nr:Di-copper centre-containing protein [Nemania abortiva]